MSSYNAVLATQNALKMLRMPPRIVEAKRPSFLTNQRSDKLTLEQSAVAARVRGKGERGQWAALQFTVQQQRFIIATGADFYSVILVCCLLTPEPRHLNSQL